MAEVINGGDGDGKHREDFKTPEHIRKIANNFPDGYNMLLNYVLDDVEGLRWSRHNSAIRMQELIFQNQLQKQAQEQTSEEIKEINDEIKAVNKKLTEVLADKNKAEGSINVLNKIGVVALVSGGIGLVAWLINLIKASGNG